MLITPLELKSHALNSFTVDLTDEAAQTSLDGRSYKEVTVEVIEDVSSQIQQELGRNLIVKKHPERVHDSRWEETGSKFLLYTPERPLIKAEDGNGNALDVTETAIEVDSIPEQVTYWAGYRRKDQSLQDIQAIGDSITQEEYDNIEILPQVLRRETIKLCIYELKIVLSNLIGFSVLTKQSGGVESNIQRREDQFHSTMQRLDTFRNL